MKIGIIANTTKENVDELVSALIKKLKLNNLDFLLNKSLLEHKNKIDSKLKSTQFLEDDILCKKSDLILSIGGDGTMLASSFYAHKYDKPVLGVNYGKLGFLAEVNISQMDTFIDEIKKNKIEIEKRMVIEGECIDHDVDRLFAINDIVIDKGGWPKMIEMTITVDGELVTTFSADGVIIATPTGSTGYSLSTGGPILSPKTDVISICPISPHSLSVRPLVLPSNQEIIITADSQHKEVQMNCDGQRVFAFPPPLDIKINKSDKPLKLVHTSLTSYFETLRNKLLWGIDLRKHSFKI